MILSISAFVKYTSTSKNLNQTFLLILKHMKILIQKANYQKKIEEQFKIRKMMTNLYCATLKKAK